MTREFTSIESGNRLMLEVRNENNCIEFGATLTNHLKKNIAIIDLDNDTGHILKFENVAINLLYLNEEGQPYIWNDCVIVYFQGQYLLQVRNQVGHRHNRRSSFRLGLSRMAHLRVMGHGTEDVILRDISLTGFSVTDRRKSLNLVQGAHVYVDFQDLGHEINFEGNVVRIEDTEDCTIYGFVITISCKDLSAYINMKQRKEMSKRRTD